jgi:hypothetical protein
MKKAILIFVLSAGTLIGYGQSAKTIFFELGGPGFASFNYDARFSGKQAKWGYRVGLGGFSTGDGSGVFLPLGINYLAGKDDKNYFEAGFGVTPAISDDGIDEFSESFAHLLFGYRLQPRNGGFVFRAFASPVINQDGFNPFFGGVSFGYKF